LGFGELAADSLGPTPRTVPIIPPGIDVVPAHPWHDRTRAFAENVQVLRWPPSCSIDPMKLAALLLCSFVAVGCAHETSDLGESSLQAHRPTCDDRKQSASGLIQDVLTKAFADVSCQSDADCTQIAVASSCTDSCSDVLNMAGAARVQAAIDDVNANVCNGFQDDGCTFTVPPCAPTGAPACVEGSCKEAR
jgi:hypothetical protein